MTILYNIQYNSAILCIIRVYTVHVTQYILPIKSEVLDIDVQINSRAFPSVVAPVLQNIKFSLNSLSLECVWRYLRDDTY
jgi:hypothetical protein